MSPTTQFDSEGFDLGAAASDDGVGEGEEEGSSSIIYEIGGGVTTTYPESPTKKQAKDNNNTQAAAPPPSPIDKSEQLKELGNEEFKLGNHLDACDYYTDAILACPYGDSVGPSGEDMMKLRDEFDESNREKIMEKQRKMMEKRRSSRNNSKDKEEGDNKNDDEEEDVDGDDNDQPVEIFTPPRHVYGTKLAVYYANRAATLLHLGRNGEVIDDCDIAILYNPTYVKAYLRRSTANERIENTEEALKDAQMAYELDPSSKVARKNVTRLQKIENERLEKLKDETMGKLKDLGNSLLGNFGLSLDNFNAVQDPNTGGYSISFDQGGNKK